MKSFASKGSRRTLATGTLTIALILGAVLTWAQTASPPVPPPAPTPAVSPADHAAAVAAFKKARDLFQAEKYNEAYAENEKAIKLDPTYSDPQTLKRILDSRITTSSTTTTETTATTRVADKFLKPSDISLIRIFEIALRNPNDQKIQGKIDRKVLEKFWDEVIRKEGTTVAADAKAKFLDPKNFLQQVQQIRDNGDTSYMEKIEFNSDPIVLLNFKNVIQPIILKNCATAACHGGDKAGTFRLFRGTSERETYTNFYILSQFTHNGGKLIDRENPGNSLLLQYGLPKDLAGFTHPKPIRPSFTDTNSSDYKNILTWITGNPTRNIPSLAFPTPNYGITYELPGSATTAPAPSPTTHPAK
ncbi:MAG: hypothetical protein FWD61_16075 [Phycisphaerales bacterium]|nr:hypothetical protein [Phycisphaerales bacterium]